AAQHLRQDEIRHLHRLVELPQHVLEEAHGARVLAQRGGLRARQRPIAHVALPPSFRQLPYQCAFLFYGRRVDFERRQIRIRKITIVVRVFLGAQRRRLRGAGIEAARLLLYLTTSVQDRRLARDLDGDGPLHELEGVDVLELYPRTETFAPLRAQGHVRVAAKAALFHVAVVDADRHQDLAYGAHVGGGLLARSQIGLTHDLDERRSRTVQIDGRGALDPVQVLAGVFFQVHTGNACGERRA